MSAVAATIAPDVFEFVRNLVSKRAAIVLEDSKAYLVDARLSPLAQRHGFSCLSELVRLLKSRAHGPLHEEVVEALTTNETSFFRDQAPFEAMRKTVLPQMIERRAAKKELSIWSAACSSGQELYSIAILLREHFPALNAWKVRLLGTDLSGQMVERARAGVYCQAEVNRGLPAAHLVKHFQRQGLQWRLNDNLRSMTTWRRFNLIEPWLDVPPMDVIFLRNVLIYFSPDTKRQIFAQIKRILRPDGVLFLGGAETTMNLDDGFERWPCDGAVCYRLRG